MGVIADNLKEIKDTLPNGVELVAVSKTKPNQDIIEAYEAGVRVFGENKIQEMAEKFNSLPKDINWHMIGHVQTNKVKYMAEFVTLIHGVDSVKLLKEINKRAKQNNRVIDCLLQVHIADEETKFGFDANEVNNLLNSEEYKLYENVRIVGLMGMATNTGNEEKVAEEFKSLKTIFDGLKENNSNIKTLSMGMSGDYKIAINNGSNMVRVGSSIFGKRNYSIN
ncbi:MAG: YggS family pyridoxal phosphate-dependent enzyme [Ichthyobacteriaceae bacterium]|nr:YggS family pyridoxal phosphate-dependent enzyme [Ichthyobacteriaceae bacterium]